MDGYTRDEAARAEPPTKRADRKAALPKGGTIEEGRPHCPPYGFSTRSGLLSISIGLPARIFALPERAGCYQRVG